MHPFCGTAVGYGQSIVAQGAMCVKSLRLRVPRQMWLHLPRRITSRADITRLEEPNSEPVDESDNALAPLTPGGNSTTPHRSARAAQTVSTVKQRVAVVRWMLTAEEKDGVKGLFAQAADKFSETFRARVHNINIKKVMSWWKQRERILGQARGHQQLSSRGDGGRARLNRKVIAGRGRRRNEWVSWIFPRLLDESDRLRKLGLQFDTLLLRPDALRLLKTSTASFTESSVDDTGTLLVDKTTSRWI
ncbi:hypothetical protein PHMEG_00024653 [Phytophthora megakarya]|uniref:Uncharacterized protein n=1 Tax=Phytophthora megakarya TaxID=4795 RepID=A0A225VFM2_9STRA|nr:hypothetical protein PHMEG_00024653 [Phytophthora megakarya]